MDKLTILIVDDRPENLESMKQLLQWDGLEILTAESGNEALGLMLDTDLALVLLDVQMPGMDGFEVAELMKRNARTRNLPIIFLTAISKERSHVFSGYEAGAVDYLFKPVDPFIIRSKVHVFLEMKRNQLAREQLVKELNRANNRLQEISDLKSDYLSAASHELRTPLTVIKEYCSLVHDEIVGPISDEQKSCLASALRNCNRLASLVNDLLDLDSIESGHSKILREEIDLRQLLHICHDDFSTRFTQTEKTIDLELDPDLPSILGDPAMVMQVLVNLMGNACKFTADDGHVILAARAVGTEVRIEVRDDGPGIAKDDQQKVFEKFAQLDRLDGPGAKGTGLGLAISRKIQDLHGGDLGVSSEPGDGSTFYLTLPVYTAEAHLSAFVVDGTRSVLDIEREWTLVLLRLRDDGLTVPQWLDRDVAGAIRGGEDRTLPLTVDGRICQGVLLQTGRVGAMSFLARLEERLRRHPDSEGVLQYALESIPIGSEGEFRLTKEELVYRDLVLKLEDKGVEHVQS